MTPWKAMPANWYVSATISTSATILIYSGQEVGETLRMRRFGFFGDSFPYFDFRFYIGRCLHIQRWRIMEVWRRATFWQWEKASGSPMSNCLNFTQNSYRSNGQLSTASIIQKTGPNRLGGRAYAFARLVPKMEKLIIGANFSIGETTLPRLLEFFQEDNWHRMGIERWEFELVDSLWVMHQRL